MWGLLLYLSTRVLVLSIGAPFAGRRCFRYVRGVMSKREVYLTVFAIVASVISALIGRTTAPRDSSYDDRIASLVADSINYAYDQETWERERGEFLTDIARYQQRDSLLSLALTNAKRPRHIPASADSLRESILREAGLLHGR